MRPASKQGAVRRTRHVSHGSYGSVSAQHGCTASHPSHHGPRPLHPFRCPLPAGCPSAVRCASWTRCTAVQGPAQAVRSRSPREAATHQPSTNAIPSARPVHTPYDGPENQISPGLIDLICPRFLFLAKAAKYQYKVHIMPDALQADKLTPCLRSALNPCPARPAVLPLFSLNSLLTASVPWALVFASWVLSLCSKHLPHSHVSFGLSFVWPPRHEYIQSPVLGAGHLLTHKTTQTLCITDQTPVTVQASTIYAAYAPFVALHNTSPIPLGYCSLHGVGMSGEVLLCG